jgi:transposase
MSMMHHRYVGLDVHRATISVAIADADQAPVSYGKIPNDPTAIHKLMQRLGGPERILHVAYEAGPTGYVVQRQLSQLGIDCLVVAPSLIPVRAGDRVKTDRRDALKLARLLRSGDLTPV